MSNEQPPEEIMQAPNMDILHTSGVRKDGTIDYTEIESYLARVFWQAGYSIHEFDGQRWVEFQIDDGAIDQIVRIPEQFLRRMVWDMDHPAIESEKQK